MAKPRIGRRKTSPRTIENVAYPEATEGFFSWLESSEISVEEAVDLGAKVSGSAGALRAILSEIVQAHARRGGKKTQKARVDAAILELIGEPLKRGRAANNETHSALRVVARLYLEQWHFGVDASVDEELLRTICREAWFEANPNADRWSGNTLRRRCKELASLFKRGKHQILIASSYRHEANPHVRKVLDGLRALKIVL